MIKFIENIFFTEIITQKSLQPFPNNDSAGNYKLNAIGNIESQKIEDGDEEIKSSIPATKPNRESGVKENDILRTINI